MERWVGKVAIVTGASSGIGAACAKDLVASGLKVAGLARRIDRLQKLEEELKGREGVLKGIKCDLTKEQDILVAFKWVDDNWGGVHVLVNNAGYLPFVNLSDFDTAKFKAAFDTNVVGLSICAREGIKSMGAHNIDDGHIVNINRYVTREGYHEFYLGTTRVCHLTNVGSVGGHTVIPHPGVAPYAATKFSVTVLSESLRVELARAKSKIRVTSLSPGLTETEMSAVYLASAEGEKPVLPASEVSKALLYVLSTPPNVNISELTIEPVGEYYSE